MALKTLGSVAVGTTVKLNINRKPVDCAIVQHGNPNTNQYAGDFEDTTLLVNSQTAGEVAWGTQENKNDYENASIRSWMQTNILNKLDASIKPYIKTVKIPYRKGYGDSTTVSKGENGLECQIFLLSLKEVGLSESSGVEEGTTFEYFKTDGKNRRIFDAAWGGWWLRTPFRMYTGGWNDEGCYGVNSDGNYSFYHVYDDRNVRYVIPISGSLYVKDDGTIIANDPPTAPGSIEVSGVVSGGEATITLTAATDPDGTVASYRYERSVDSGEFQQFADVNALTRTDTISGDWSTIAYRACAVDDAGASGPYVTSKTETINSGWVTIGGPAETMGSKPKQFNFDFSVSVSGQSSTGAITVSAALDGEQIYSGTPSAGTQLTIPIKTHLLGAGTHAIEVQASKDDYLPASKRYTFTVPAVAIPDGGVGALAQDPKGRAVYHTTLAQRCIGTGGVDIQAQMDALAARVKTLEG